MLLTNGEKVDGTRFKSLIWELLEIKLKRLDEEENRIIKYGILIYFWKYFKFINKLLSLLEKMNFHEQETNRDILRLKYSLTKFLLQKKNRKKYFKKFKYIINKEIFCV